jgi:hypothetical protein
MKRCDPKRSSWWIEWFESDTSAIVWLNLLEASERGKQGRLLIIAL